MGTSKDNLIATIATEDLSDEQIALIESIASGRVKELPATTGGFLSIKAAQAYLGGVSRTFIWALSKDGLRMHRVGRRVLLKAFEIDAFIASRDLAAAKTENGNGPRAKVGGRNG